MKVLIISTHAMPTEATGGNGLGRLVSNIALYLQSVGCDITIFASKGSVIDGIRIFEYSNPILELSNILSSINLEKYDIVLDFSHNKYLSKYHSHRNIKIINYIADEECDYTPKNSLVGNRYQLIRHQSALVYPIGVDLNEFNFYAKKQEYLSFAGKIEKRKGYDIAIEIAKLSGKKLILAGGIMTWEPNNINDLLGQEWVGEIRDKKQYCDFVGNSCCLLYPSRKEAGGMGILEAMAMGTPCITISGTGTSCFVEHGITGYVADDVESAVEYCDKIEDLDPEKIRKYCEENYDMHKNFNNIYELMKEVINGKTW